MIGLRVGPRGSLECTMPGVFGWGSNVEHTTRVCHDRRKNITGMFLRLGARRVRGLPTTQSTVGKQMQKTCQNKFVISLTVGTDSFYAHNCRTQKVLKL